MPGKLLAFSSPVDSAQKVDLNQKRASVEEVLVSLKKLKVQTVVKLAGFDYPLELLTDNNIVVKYLPIEEEAFPSEKKISEFFKICDSATGPIAIHCTAGIGRTSMLIGLYAIKYF